MSVVAVAAVAALLGVVLWSPASRPRRASGPAKARASATSTTTTSVPPPTTTTVDPGSLPQTDQLPPASTPQFNGNMAALWQGIATGSVSLAMPAFFPQAAYVQLKSGIVDPAGDWQNRLVAEYALDVGAAHDLLGTDSTGSSLVNVSVPEQYAHWIPPGVCANGIGYWEVANARVVYTQAGGTSSIGIASLISWRGEWYVVHLGAILRSGSGGEVDEPALGPGSSAPSSTC